MHDRADDGKGFRDFTRSDGDINTGSFFSPQTADIIDDAIRCHYSDIIDPRDIITSNDSGLFSWAMANHISDEERTSRIDIDDDSDAYDIAIKGILEISGSIRAEKSRILIAELVHESLRCAIDEIGFIKFLST